MAVIAGPALEHDAVGPPHTRPLRELLQVSAPPAALGAFYAQGLCGCFASAHGRHPCGGWDASQTFDVLQHAAVCDEATVSFNATAVCAKFASGQFAIFAAGVAAVVGGEIVLAVPYTAAPLLQNAAAQVAGKVLVIQRGGSPFQDKAERAQAAGAVGAIIVNNVAGDPIVMSGTFTSITIPVVMVPMSVSAALQASQGLRITIRPKVASAGATRAALLGRLVRPQRTLQLPPTQVCTPSVPRARTSARPARTPWTSRTAKVRLAPSASTISTAEAGLPCRKPATGRGIAALGSTHIRLAAQVLSARDCFRSARSSHLRLCHPCRVARARPRGPPHARRPP